MTLRHRNWTALFKSPVLAAVLLLAASAAPGGLLAQALPPAGLYTLEQAERGERTFLGNCVGCHGYSMSSIFSRYQNAYIYYGTIQATMPWEDAGHLPIEDYIDIVAYMMRENGFVPGDTELVLDRALLESIIPPRAGSR